MDGVEDAAPAGEAEDGVDPAGGARVVGGIGVVLFGIVLGQGEVDEDGGADDGGAGRWRPRGLRSRRISWSWG